MIEVLKSWDTELLLLINGMRSPALDVVMWGSSQKWVWLPLYVYFFILIRKTFGDNFWKIVLLILLGIVLSDQVSTQVFKNLVMRYRPCHNLLLQDKIILLNEYCGGMYGFVSSHAANSMMLATLVFIYVSRNRFLVVLLFLYVFLNMYSRIYLGVHYPSDVVCGALLGFLLARLLSFLYDKFVLKNEN